MSCTTLLVGKKATYDGSLIIARNDDSQSGVYTEKKCVVVSPEEQPVHYKSVLSAIELDLPEDPMRYTAVPNAVEGEGIWAACGVNEAGVGMSATETITSNARVLGADPLVFSDDKPAGLGEEDFVTVVLPYIKSAREGVLRLGSLLETHGTYEMNGIAFVDQDEIWWMETIGGHHWMAKKVPDDVYVAMPNQQGIDAFDFSDHENCLYAHDLPEFVQKYHLDLSLSETFDVRSAFGSHEDADHVYNTPRAWMIHSILNPHRFQGEPEADDLPWCMIPEKKITVEDVKTVLSSTFQGTPYDPYGSDAKAGKYRSIGVNRTSFLGLVQVRPDKEILEWIAFGSNPFNALIPLYADVDTMPAYLSETTGRVDTGNFYWVNRLIGAMADAAHAACKHHIERYQNHLAAKAHALIHATDALLEGAKTEEEKKQICQDANEKMAQIAQKASDRVLVQVLDALSSQMKNAYARSDA